MIRRPGALRLAVAGSLVAGALAIAGAAWGDSGTTTLDAAAWWYKPNQGGLTAPAPPTVPDGGLLVQGQPDGASSLAGLRFTVAKGQGSPVLTLSVASETDSPDGPPILGACLAGSAWSGSGEQPWGSAPPTDCSASVQGILSNDKKSYTFALAPLLQGNVLDIVLTPGTVEGRPAQIGGSTFSIAFNKPTDASLATEAGFDSSTPFAPPPLAADPAPSDVPLGIDAPIADPLGGAAFTPSLPAAQQGRTATAPVRRLATQANVAAATKPLQDRRGVAALVLLLGAVAAMFVNREPVPAPRRLGPLAGRALATEGPAVVAEPGGLGRFARPRIGAPPRL